MTCVIVCQKVTSRRQGYGRQERSKSQKVGELDISRLRPSFFNILTF